MLFALKMKTLRRRILCADLDALLLGGVLAQGALQLLPSLLQLPLQPRHLVLGHARQLAHCIALSLQPHRGRMSTLVIADPHAPPQEDSYAQPYINLLAGLLSNPLSFTRPETTFCTGCVRTGP